MNCHTHTLNTSETKRVWCNLGTLVPALWSAPTPPPSWSTVPPVTALHLLQARPGQLSTLRTLPSEVSSLKYSLYSGQRGFSHTFKLSSQRAADNVTIGFLLTCVSLVQPSPEIFFPPAPLEITTHKLGFIFQVTKLIFKQWGTTRKDLVTSLPPPASVNLRKEKGFFVYLLVS